MFPQLRSVYHMPAGLYLVINCQDAQGIHELKENEKTEKGEYCAVLDLHGVNLPEEVKEAAEWPMEAKLIEEMKQGASLRDAQEKLIRKGEKKNAVKQAALPLKKLFED